MRKLISLVRAVTLIVALPFSALLLPLAANAGQMCAPCDSEMPADFAVSAAPGSDAAKKGLDWFSAHCEAGKCKTGSENVCDNMKVSAICVCVESTACDAKAGDKPPQRTVLYDPLDGATLETFFARAIKVFTGISGSVALAAFVYGGFMMTTAAGNDEMFKKGKEAMVWAVLGLLVMFGAYAFLRFFFGALGVK